MSNGEIDHFVLACIGETETLSPVEDGLEMMKNFMWHL